MKIEFAPWNVSIERRLQTLAAAIMVFILLFGQLMCFAIVALLLYKGHWIIQCATLAYLAFIYIDRKTADLGGRGAGCPWFRNFLLWKYFGDYFPVDLVKTTELRPDRNYLFALFPHGILSFGAFCNFNSNHSKFAMLFPGIRAKMLTLSFHFNIPIFREILFSWGMAAASKDSISNMLNASTDPLSPANVSDGFTSNGVMIVVGGAQEALYSSPKNYTVYLKNRKGFVRLAIKSGMPLVPVISFNEVDIFDQVKGEPGTKLRRFQEWVKGMTGVTPVLFSGRGFFQYSFGLIPMRKAITTVVGAPLEVSQSSKPSDEEIDKVHTQFCHDLSALFEMHKAKYVEGHETVKLVIE